jgi:hypothetical protein
VKQEYRTGTNLGSSPEQAPCDMIRNPSTHGQVKHMQFVHVMNYALLKSNYHEDSVGVSVATGIVDPRSEWCAHAL